MPSPSSRPRQARASVVSSASSKAKHEVRIIGGEWRRRKLPVADKPGLRPTPDRVRETLFNWLGQDLTGWTVLDAFAGTGALGLEAASRGASAVMLVEQDAALARCLQAIVTDWQAQPVQVLRGDGVAQMQARSAASLDLVLLDPPFALPLFEPALEAAARVIKPGGWIYLEAPREWTDADLLPWRLTVYRHLKAGAVHAHLLRA